MDTELYSHQDSQSQSIFDAADALVASGHDVSLTLIEDQLAPMDPALILPILQEWRFRRAVIQSPPGGVWQAVVMTFSALKGDIEGLTARMNAQIEQKRIEWIKENERGNEERDQSQHHLEDEMMASQRRLIQVLSYMSELETLIDQAVPMLETLEKSQKEQADLQRQLQDTLAERDQAALKESEACKRADDLDARYAQLSEEFETAINQLREEQSERDKLSIQCADLSKHIEIMDADLNRYRELEEQAQLEAEQEAQRLGREGDWLLAAEDWPELPRQLAVATARMAALRAERDSLKERITDLKEQLKQSHDLLTIQLGGSLALTSKTTGKNDNHPRIEVLKGGRR